MTVPGNLSVKKQLEHSLAGVATGSLSVRRAVFGFTARCFLPLHTWSSCRAKATARCAPQRNVPNVRRHPFHTDTCRASSHLPTRLEDCRIYTRDRCWIERQVGC